MAWIWKVWERVKIIFIAVVFNFIMNLILINLLWVYWAALATWIWWILIWILSEYFLWKEYKTKFNYKYLLKNILIMWTIWIFTFKFILIYFEWLSRINSMLLLTVFSIIYSWIFVIFNYSEFKFFILEIKKIRKWN